MADFPPDFNNFVQTESKVPGIEVFMPKPIEEAHQEVVAFSCVQCGASQAYSAENDNLTCTHCGHYEVAEKEVVGKQAQQLEFTVETMERAAEGWGTDRKELVCDNCGGHTTLPPTLLTDSCPFCHSNRVHQHQAPQDVLRPGFLIPLQITQAAAESILQNWVGEHWMLAEGLKQAVKGADIRPIFIPFYTIGATARAEWRAQVGHVRRSHNGRTKVVWRWESGKVRSGFEDLPILGSTHLNEKLAQHILPFDFQDLVPYEASFLAGIAAQAQEISLEDAWTEARARMRESVRVRCADQPSTSRVRNFRMGLDFSEESWRYTLLPVYLASYSLDGKSYQVLINGQSGKITGQKPVDWKKVKTYLGLGFLPGILLGAVGLLLSGTESPLFLAGIGAVLAAGFVAIKLYEKARKFELT